MFDATGMMTFYGHKYTRNNLTNDFIILEGRFERDKLVQGISNSNNTDLNDKGLNFENMQIIPVKYKSLKTSKFNTEIKIRLLFHDTACATWSLLSGRCSIDSQSI